MMANYTAFILPLLTSLVVWIHKFTCTKLQIWSLFIFVNFELKFHFRSCLRSKQAEIPQTDRVGAGGSALLLSGEASFLLWGDISSTPGRPHISRRWVRTGVFCGADRNLYSSLAVWNKIFNVTWCMIVYSKWMIHLNLYLNGHKFNLSLLHECNSLN